MIIRHYRPEKPFVMVDRNVVTNSKLSDGAVRLYIFFHTFPNGGNYTDAYICKAMGISAKTLARRKKELTEANLILVDQLNPRMYIIYIGSSKCTAQETKIRWNSNAYSISCSEDEKSEETKV